MKEDRLQVVKLQASAAWNSRSRPSLYEITNFSLPAARRMPSIGPLLYSFDAIVSVVEVVEIGGLVVATQPGSRSVFPVRIGYLGRLHAVGTRRPASKTIKLQFSSMTTPMSSIPDFSAEGSDGNWLWRLEVNSSD